MKKLASILAFMLFVATACDNEKVVEATKLPVNAQDYIEAHLQGAGTQPRGYFSSH